MKASDGSTGERILNAILAFAGRESLGMIRKRAISAGNGVVRGIRYSLLLHYLILIFCFLTALSFFAAFYLLSQQLSDTGGLHLTWSIYLCGLLFIFCSFVLFFTIREKTWLRVFQVEEIVDAVLGQRTPVESTLSRETVAKIVEETLERRFKELSDQLANKT